MGETPPPSPEEIKNADIGKESTEASQFLEKEELRDFFRSKILEVEKNLEADGNPVDYWNADFWPKLWDFMSHDPQINATLSEKGTVNKNFELYGVIAARAFGQGLQEAGLLSPDQEKAFEKNFARVGEHIKGEEARLTKKYLNELRSEVGAENYERIVDVQKYLNDELQFYFLFYPAKLFNGNEVVGLIEKDAELKKTFEQDKNHFYEILGDYSGQLPKEHLPSILAYRIAILEEFAAKGFRKQNWNVFPRLSKAIINPLDYRYFDFNRDSYESMSSKEKEIMLNIRGNHDRLNGSPLFGSFGHKVFQKMELPSAIRPKYAPAGIKDAFQV